MNPSSRYAKQVEEIETCPECKGFIEGWDLPCEKHILLLTEIIKKKYGKDWRKKLTEMYWRD